MASWRQDYTPRQSGEGAEVAGGPLLPSPAAFLVKLLQSQGGAVGLGPTSWVGGWGDRNDNCLSASTSPQTQQGEPLSR